MDGNRPHLKDVLNNLAKTLHRYGAAVLMTLAGMVSAPVALGMSMVRTALETSFSLTGEN